MVSGVNPPYEVAPPPWEILDPPLAQIVGVECAKTKGFPKWGWTMLPNPIKYFIFTCNKTLPKQYHIESSTKWG